MKIYFDNVQWGSSSGPHYFAHQLATQLSYMGHIIADPNDYDIALVFIESTHNLNLGKPCCQRLDGIWFKPEEFWPKNKNIRHFYQGCDHVIWQSEFDKEMTLKWFGLPRAGSVIKNGTLAKKVSTSREGLLDIRNKYSKVFVCSASWHGQKRLKDNIRLFAHIRNTIELNSCLIVMGDNPQVENDLIKNQPIFFSGKIEPEMCLEVFSISDWMIHLAFCDHSPNVILQALSQGCPVICSEVGGTKEIVGNNGIILKDAPYNYELCDYENPPPIDIAQVKSLPDIKVVNPDIDMKKVAENYIKVFETTIYQYSMKNIF
jgi:glycosyltransferase involved in cell wall biosynthesis